MLRYDMLRFNMHSKANRNQLSLKHEIKNDKDMSIRHSQKLHAARKCHGSTFIEPELWPIEVLVPIESSYTTSY